jgi:hypothetical protein
MVSQIVIGLDLLMICKAPLFFIWFWNVFMVLKKKQKIVAQSITKAEFLAAAEAVNQALLIRKLLKDVQVFMWIVSQYPTIKCFMERYQAFQRSCAF